MRTHRQIWFLFILLMFAGISRADETPEALQKRLQIVSDAEKPKLLVEIGKSYIDSNPGRSIDYFREAVGLTNESEHPKEVGDAYYLLGIAYKNISEYDKSLSYHFEALKIRQKTDSKTDIADSYHQIGIVYDYLSDYSKALEYHERALSLRREAEDKKGVSDSLHNIGIINHLSGKFDAALQSYLEALEIRELLNDQQGIGGSDNNIGFLYMDMEKYQESLEYFKRALEIFEGIGDQYEIANVSNNIASLYLKLGDFDNAQTHLDKGLILANDIGAKEIIRENYTIHSDLSAAKEDYQKALEYYKLAMEVKDSIFNAESSSRIAEIQTRLETEKKEKEIEILKKDNEIKELELDRQKLITVSFIGGFSLICLLFAVLFTMYRMKKKAHASLQEAHAGLEEAHQVIQVEKEKSDKLLLNILPVRVASDLKEKGYTEPESFENVTVFFSDIVGFTKLSSNLDPKYLIDELNYIYTAFDNIVELNECERIKTIGDAYLCVCGMPAQNPNHADNIIRSAIQMIKFLHERNQHLALKWEIRVGVHTGKVVGGVVGIKKYIYDVFGDTINTASRMQSDSMPMKINISEATHQFVKNNYKFTEREEIQVKGKGMMKMYFVEF